MSTWLSGASGDGAASGAFGTWRGTPIGIGGTWNDSVDAEVNEWTIQPGAEWGTWSGPFRALQLAILPGSHLVFCPNDGTSASLSLDWRAAFPGNQYVDVMSVDSYNQYPWVNTFADFQSKINTTNSYGAPVGIEKHRLYSASVGLPFAVSEWASNASMGDAPFYIDCMKNWFNTNAGTGAGQLLYEIYFNVLNYNSGVFALYPTNTQPKTAAEYVALF